MTIPVLINERNGIFEAKLAGEPGFRASGGTRSDAILAQKNTLNEKEKLGELFLMRMDSAPITHFSGIWSDHDDLDEIVSEIYRQREAERSE